MRPAACTRRATARPRFTPSWTKKLPTARPPVDLAYADVKAAFQYYLAHYNEGRPIIIAGHSQGTAHATRLLHEFFEHDPKLRRQLVAAYLIGIQSEARRVPNY
jgi:alpha-beta hydrolase superfamily lysophospholipase